MLHMGFGLTRSVSRGDILYCFFQCWHLDKEAVFIFKNFRTAVQVNITRPRSAIAAAIYGAAINVCQKFIKNNI